MFSAKKKGQAENELMARKTRDFFFFPFSLCVGASSSCSEEKKQDILSEELTPWLEKQGSWRAPTRTLAALAGFHSAASHRSCKTLPSPGTLLTCEERTETDRQGDGNCCHASVQTVSVSFGADSDGRIGVAGVAAGG